MTTNKNNISTLSTKVSTINPWTYLGTATKTNTVSLPSSWTELLYLVTTLNNTGVALNGYIIKDLLTKTPNVQTYGTQCSETTNGNKVAARVKITTTTINTICVHNDTTEVTNQSNIFVWYK